MMKMENIKEFILNHKKILLKGVIVILSLFALGIIYNTFIKGKYQLDRIEYVDSLKRHHIQYVEGDFSDLKKENKELYDSLKKYKDQIDYLLQFNYEKDYHTGKVYTNNAKNESLTDSTYVYEHNGTDSIDYKLQINSYKEPNWFSLDVKVHDKITIVNKEQGDGVNHLTIETDNKADASDVTVFKKKKKGNIFNKFVIMPGLYYGYDVKNHNLGYGVGVTVGYNFFGTK